MRHTILATIMLVALSFSAEAYDFKKGDLCYTITERNNVEVTKDDSYSNLTSITIPLYVINENEIYPVTGIGSEAFSGCSGLTSVTIPISVTSIGENAFYGCSGLTSVTIAENSNLTNIGSNAFSECSRLTSITIPNSVTSIGGYAFKNCSRLRSITIPKLVTSIGENAFSECSRLTTVTFAENSKLTSIDKNAFSECSKLTSITIPNSVTSIGDGAFYGCSGLTSVTIAENSNLTNIGSNAFSECSRLTSITIPNSVTSIGDGAFYGCSGLASVTFAENSKLTSIDKNAFSECSKLTSITIPNSVTSIGDGAFYGCSGLASVTFAENSKLTSIDKNAFYGCTGLTTVTFAENSKLTSIGENAFSECSRLTSITIPNSVKAIGYYAFNGCSGLASVTIPNSVTSIGDGAFTGCDNITTLTYNSNNIGLHFSRKSKLSTINIGDSVSYISPSTFQGCSGLKSITIPNSVKAIGDYAFNGCSGLASITIPNSVKAISVDAFYGCSGLASVTIPNSVTSIGNGAFGNVKHIVYNGSATGSPWGAITMNGIIDGDLVYTNAQKDTLIAYIGTGGDVTIPNSVTSIGSNAFSNCSGLTSITIPNSVKSIGSNAFSNCSGLTSVTFAEYSKLTSIGSNAFSNCSGLTSITIPNSVTSIGENAFSNCSGLTSVNFAENSQLTSIDPKAFIYCEGLTSITIPNSVKSIGDYAFGHCSGLTSVNFAENSQLTSIGNDAFFYCEGLTSVTIPNSTTSIGVDAFYYCHNLEKVDYRGTIGDWLNIGFSNSNANPLYYAQKLYINNEEMTNVVIPDTITEIKHYVFNGYSGLTSVTIPNSVKSIGVDAFADCRGLPSVTIPNSVTSISKYSFNGIKHISYNGNATGSPWGARIVTKDAVADGDFVYTNDQKDSLLIYIGTDDNAIIPNSVTIICDKAFYDCTSLTSVNIPNSVKSIGDYAFDGCSGLTSLTIPNSVTSIGNRAFDGCSGLTSLTIPNSVTSIGNHAFDGIKHISYNGNATGSPWGARIVTKDAIADGDFVYTNDQKDSLLIYIGTDGNAIIPNSVTIICDKAFYDCTSLTSVNIPNSVKSIGDGAFINCSGLTSLTIPNSVTSIGENAFSNCSGLTSITIPNSVTSIGDGAFINCSGLTSLTIPNSVTNIGSNAFSNCSGLTSVSIPNSVTSIDWGAFTECTSSIFYCQATEKPSGWDVNWNIDNRPVVWGCKAVSLSANDNTFGTVSGGGIFSTGFSINIKAISAKHYHFAKWSDGNTENPRSIKVTSDTTLIAVFAIDTLKVNTFAENGTVSGAGLYAYGASASLTATPTEHYHFTRWSDGNTENPRSTTVTTDMAFTAMFAIDTLKVTASAENGTVLGAGEYTYGISILLVATPAEHYHFAKWNDGNTENPRSITVTEDITLVAIFEKADAIDTLKVTASAENGTVLGAGEYTYGISILLVATPAEHYHFAKWSDGNTENPRSIKVTSDTTLIAVFAIDTLKVNTFAENGTVSGAGLYAYGTQTSLTATPAKNFHFAKWSDGNTENPRSITVTEDITLIAIFEKADAIDTLKVTASAENGTVFGAGEFAYGTSILLGAIPAEHYHFAKWSDGNIENPRSITVTENITLVAIFEKAAAIDTLKVTASAENGTVFGAGEFAYGATTSLTATPAEHYHFAKWSDGNTENPRSIKVTSDTTLIAMFAIDTLKVTAFAENGTVSGAGLYAYGTQTSLTATPAENYHFVKWSDGNTENPRSITVTEDITLIAIFEKADAISTDAVADVKIYAHHNVIVVENATDDIYVYDAMGRLIARNSDSNRNAVHHVSTEITMRNTGIYIVKVGNETKRVAVSQN